MKQILHKIASTFLAVIVLFSTFSFTVDSHYCGDVLVDFSIFSDAQGCGMDDLHQDECDSESVNDICNDDDLMHCKNIQKSIEGNLIEQQAFENSELQKVFFLLSFIQTYSSLFISNNANVIVFSQYQPPFSDTDLTLLFENFRI